MNSVRELGVPAMPRKGQRGGRTCQWALGDTGAGGGRAYLFMKY